MSLRYSLRNKCAVSRPIPPLAPVHIHVIVSIMISRHTDAWGLPVTRTWTFWSPKSIGTRDNYVRVNQAVETSDCQQANDSYRPELRCESVSEDTEMSSECNCAICLYAYFTLWLDGCLEGSVLSEPKTKTFARLSNQRVS